MKAKRSTPKMLDSKRKAALAGLASQERATSLHNQCAGERNHKCKVRGKRPAYDQRKENKVFGMTAWTKATLPLLVHDANITPRNEDEEYRQAVAVQQLKKRLAAELRTTLAAQYGI